MGNMKVKKIVIESTVTILLYKRYKERNKTMTEREKEIINDNLQAYINNFRYLKIEKQLGGFYVYTSEERYMQGSWTQYCYNIDYLNGWLYGAVQAANGIMKKFD